MPKFKLTRPELKKQRDAHKRFQRYLPMLKLRQQQLQMQFHRAETRLAEAEREWQAAEDQAAVVRVLLAAPCGLDLDQLVTPVAVHTRPIDVAGLSVPELVDVEFPSPSYSLLHTPAWTEAGLARLRAARRAAELVRVTREQRDLVRRELARTIQRVNLFERVKIPEARDIIRKIRIRLGDEMTSAIGRGKIAKGKITAAGAGDAP